MKITQNYTFLQSFTLKQIERFYYYQKIEYIKKFLNYKTGQKETVEIPITLF